MKKEDFVTTPVYFIHTCDPWNTYKFDRLVNDDEPGHIHQNGQYYCNVSDLNDTSFRYYRTIFNKGITGTVKFKDLTRISKDKYKNH